MTVRSLISLIFATALLGAAALHGGEGSCNASARDCSRQIRHMLGGRRYLGIQVVELKPGLIIKSVLPDSPASSHLKAGDRLIGVNGRSLTQASAREFKQHLAAAKTGKVFLIVLRRGAYRKIEARLEEYPEEYIQKAVAAHLAQAHTATAGAQP